MTGRASLAVASRVLASLVAMILKCLPTLQDLYSAVLVCKYIKKAYDLNAIRTTLAIFNRSPKGSFAWLSDLFFVMKHQFILRHSATTIFWNKRFVIEMEGFHQLGQLFASMLDKADAVTLLRKIWDREEPLVLPENEKWRKGLILVGESLRDLSDNEQERQSISQRLATLWNRPV